MFSQMLGKYCVVTNTSRGVYFGKVTQMEGDAVCIEEARHCFSFTCFPESKGTWGLALRGPNKGSRIGPELPFLYILNVSGIAPVSEEALANWKDATWV